MKKQVNSTAIFILLLIVIAGCSNGDENSDEQSESTRLVAVETIVMEADSFDDYIRLTGTVEAIDDATISAEAQGRILNIAERGEQVTHGGMIARLDSRLIQAQYNSAKTAYELAMDNYQRLENLHADSIISTQDFQNAKAQRDQAEAQLEQAEKQLEDSTIEAPFSGRVEQRFIQPGELISPGMPVARLVNTDRVRILAGIPERYSGEITEGSAVEVEIRGVNNESFSSTITYAGNVIDPDTRTFTVEIEMSNPERLIKPEMVADLRVKRRQVDNALIIPRTAVLRSEDGVNLFRAVQQNGHKIAEIIPIETGEATGALVEVISGISEEDEIVISGMSNLNDGDRLNILNTETSPERAEKLSQAQRPFVSY